MEHKDNSKSFLEEFRREQIKRLKKGAISLTNEIKRELAVKCPPHSAPGESPHLETGELRRSITFEVDESELKARVGSNKVYSRYLELGTSEMEARPFLEKALEEQWPEIQRLMSGK